MNVIKNPSGKPWLTDEEIDEGIPVTKEGYVAERHLYKIMQSELPPEWTVLYDRSYPGEGGAQLDFVVIVPGKGIVNVDAKGRGYKLVGGSVRLGGDPTNKDVFAEATRGARVLSNYLKDNVSDGCEWGAWAYLVVFTEEGFAAPLPGCYLQPPDLADEGVLQDKIEETLSAFSFQFTKFSHWGRPILDLLTASAGSVPTPIDFLGMEKYSRTQLDSDQQAIAYAMGCGKCLHVMGGAGTGKTLIALAIGKELAEQDKRVLYVCFNTSLAEFHQRDIRRSKKEKLRKNIVVSSFHRIGQCLTGKCYTQTVGGNFSRELTDRKMSHCMIKDFFNGRGMKFDVLLVDEAQDLTNENIAVLLGLLKKDRQIAIFSDARQTIFAKEWTLDMRIFGEHAEILEYELHKNYRNTEKIFEHFKCLSHEATIPVIRTGLHFKTKDVESIACDQVEATISEMLKIGRHNREIAILATDKRLFTGLNKAVSRDGTNVYFKRDIPAWTDDKSILMTTVQSFKGLEADIVFFLGTESDTEQVRYVAESRAKYELYIVQSPQ